MIDSREILQEIHTAHWETAFSEHQKHEAIEAIEGGKIILLPELSFDLLPEERTFFTSDLSDTKAKNISFNILNDTVRGTTCQGSQVEHLKAMMKRYALYTTSLLDALFPSYSQAIQIGRTSFRPIEIFGRIPKSYRKDDTRLHVDAFPMSPTQGKRIFRVFTNINPHGKERIWHVGEPFLEVAKKFLPTVKKSWFGRSTILNALNLTKSYCTEYDYAMLQIHNNMKGSQNYQKTAPKCEIRFSPHSTWIVQTDSVTHAALAGQHVLEQTFYLPIHVMAKPQLSPLRILEKLSNRSLVNPNLL